VDHTPQHKRKMHEGERLSESVEKNVGQPAGKRLKVASKEKSCEKVADAEAAKLARKQELAKTKEASKVEKQKLKEMNKLRVQQEKEQKKADAELEKDRRMVFKKYAMELGDSLKSHVQGRCKGLDAAMTDEQYNWVFQGYPSCTKEITTKCMYSDGRVTTSVRHEDSAVHLNEGEVKSIFGIGKTKGGSYNGFHGATEWCITSMIVTRPRPGRVVMQWKLSSGANWSR